MTDTNQLLRDAQQALESARHAIRNLVQTRPAVQWTKWLAVSGECDAVNDAIAAHLSAQPEAHPLTTNPVVRHEGLDLTDKAQAAQSGMVPLNNNDVLWLWKDGDKMLAFRHLYPCYSPGGDPMTLGEPWGKAIFRHSHDRAAAPQAVPWPQNTETSRLLANVADAARRLVEHADFQLGGILSADSRSKEIPSKAVSQVKARHLASLRDRIAELDAAHGITAKGDGNG